MIFKKDLNFLTVCAASAALARLDDVHRHRLRRTALHLPPASPGTLPS
jgi:hypothetical protein